MADGGALHRCNVAGYLALDSAVLCGAMGWFVDPTTLYRLMRKFGITGDA